MKKRRLAIVAFLLCACVGLGIGYAALSDSLTINGDVTVKPHAADFKVHFTEVKNSAKTTTTIQTDTTVATFTSTQLQAAGESAFAIIEVKNSSTGYKAQMGDFAVSSTSDSHVQSHFEVVCEYVQDNGDGTYTVIAAPELEVNGTTLVRVTVTLKSQPIEEIIYKFTLTATTTAIGLAA